MSSFPAGYHLKDSGNGYQKSNIIRQLTNDTASEKDALLANDPKSYPEHILGLWQKNLSPFHSAATFARHTGCHPISLLHALAARQKQFFFLGGLPPNLPRLRLHGEHIHPSHMHSRFASAFSGGAFLAAPSLWHHIWDFG